MTAPLETGKSYWLVETRAPAGHALLPRAVAFHIEVGADVDATTVIKTDFGADEGFSSVRVLPASGSLPGDRTPGIRVVGTQVGVPPKSDPSASTRSWREGPPCWASPGPVPGCAGRHGPRNARRETLRRGRCS